MQSKCHETICHPVALHQYMTHWSNKIKYNGLNWVVISVQQLLC